MLPGCAASLPQAPGGPRLYAERRRFANDVAGRTAYLSLPPAKERGEVEGFFSLNFKMFIPIWAARARDRLARGRCWVRRRHARCKSGPSSCASFSSRFRISAVAPARHSVAAAPTVAFPFCRPRLVALPASDFRGTLAASPSSPDV